jgi:hypothetical protein
LRPLRGTLEALRLRVVKQVARGLPAAQVEYEEKHYRQITAAQQPLPA